MIRKQDILGLGKCRLCGASDKVLNSHILPEFIYRNLYDPHHRFLDLGSSYEKILKIQQKGLRERLLCGDCEMHLCKYESYAAGYLNRPTKLSISLDDEVIVNPVDYNLFKLFQISILWRAHHSIHPLFQKVDVGRKHEMKLRTMILGNQPGEPHEYGCVMAAAKFGKRSVDDFISHVIHRREDGHNHFTLIFAGFVWSYVVSSHTQNHALNNFFLQRDGALIIPSCEVENSPIFFRAFEFFQKKKEVVEKL